MKKEPDKEVRDADEVIRSYYKNTTEGAFRNDGTEPVSFVRHDQHKDEAHSTDFSGDLDAVSNRAAGIETIRGLNGIPYQDIVDNLGRAVGITYQDNEPLKCDDKTANRDDQRWELDPASSEDYRERTANGDGPSSTPDAASSGTTEMPARPKSNTRLGGRSAVRGRPPS